VPVASCSPVAPTTLAVTHVGAPAKLTLSAKKPVLTVPIRVEVQNRASHDEIISAADTLKAMVELVVESLGPCPPPTIRFKTETADKIVPLVLKPKKKVKVTFDLTFDCANDRAVSTKKDPGHEDFRYRAVVHHSAIDGAQDVHVGDDRCPRGPLGIDPFPDGKINDKGCGTKRSDKMLGGDVRTDVVVK